MTLTQLHYHRYRTDPEYRIIVDAICAGYRGEKNPFVMSVEDAKRFNKAKE